jgi:hypothetical protein
MAYIEPAPLLDKENPFEAMMTRFRTASQILGLEEQVYNVLKSPARQVIVSRLKRERINRHEITPRFFSSRCFLIIAPYRCPVSNGF